MKAEQSRVFKDPEAIKAAYVGEELNRGQAIKAKCLDCCCGQRDEVTLCPAVDCPLWPYRFGTNPYSNRKPMSEEQKEAFRQRMLAMQKQISSEETFGEE